MLSLHHRPGSVVFLDDDPDYLETLALVLPARWHAEFFLRPAPLVERLTHDALRWQALIWREQQIAARWRSGEPLVPQILRHWSETDERYALIRVCMVDYSMPAMNGLQFLREVEAWPGARVLLTGRADEQIAVQAFNDRLIERYLPKQTPDIAARVDGAIAALMNTQRDGNAQPWAASLRPEQLALLHDREVAAALAREIGARGWVEYAVLGSPFGVLGLDPLGHAGWLQLEMQADLSEVAELAESQGWSAERVAQLRGGACLTDLELRQGLGTLDEATTAPAHPIDTQERLLFAAFELAAEQSPGPKHSYADFLKRCGGRSPHN